MICPSCKIEIPDGSEFCNKCGCKIIEQAKDINSMQKTDDTTVETKDETKDEESQDKYVYDIELEDAFVVENTTKPKKKKWILGILVVMVLCCVGVLALVKLGFISFSKKASFNSEAQEAYLNFDGNAFFTVKDNVVKIPGDYTSAFVSKDGKNFVCLDADKTLFYFASPTADKEKIDVDVDSIECITNTDVYYATYSGKAPTIDEVINRTYEDSLEEYSTLTKDDYYDLFRFCYEGTYEDAKSFYAYMTEKNFPESEYVKVVYHKYNYNSKKTLELVYAGKYVFSEDSSIAAAIDDSSKLVAYMPQSDSQKELCTVSANAELLGFNDDLSCIVWYEMEKKDPADVAKKDVKAEKMSTKVTDDKSSEDKETKEEYVCNIYQLVGDGKVKIGSLGSVTDYELKNGCYVNIHFLNEKNDFVIYRNSSSTIILGGVNKEAKAINLSKEVSMCMTDKGDMLSSYRGHNLRMARVEKILVLVDGDNKDLYDVYQVDFTGESAKLLSRVKQICGVYNKYMVYTDRDDSLQICEWSNGVINNELKITSNVVNAEITPNGKYVLIEKDMGNPDYDLYYVDLVSSDYTPTKIHSNVKKYYYTSKDSKIYIIADATDISDFRYGRSGDLYSVSIGKDSKKITKDVMELDTVFSGDIVASKKPVVIKFSYVDSSHDDAKIYDLGIIEKENYTKLFGEVVDKYDK